MSDMLVVRTASTWLVPCDGRRNGQRQKLASTKQVAGREAKGVFLKETMREGKIHKLLTGTPGGGEEIGAG